MAGRPRNREVDEALRAAALEIFLESGFAALTLEGVAGRAGVSRASLYRRWTRREDLLADALRAQRSAFDGFAAGWDIPLASLLALFADRVRTVFADQRLRRLIMQLLSLGPEASAIRDEYFAAVVAPRCVAFARAIAAAAAAGETPAVPLTGRAAEIHAALTAESAPASTVVALPETRGRRFARALELIDRVAVGRVHVRTPDVEPLAALIRARGASAERDGTDALDVTGLDATAIGLLARDHRLALAELTPHRASLEAAYMDLTRDDAEYHSEGAHQ